MEAADLYNATNILAKRTKVLRDFFQKCEERKPLSGNLLDLGCGDGGVTDLVKSLVGPKVSVEGSDKDENMVDFARKHFSASGIRFFVLGLEEELPSELHQRYDYVVSSFVLHWIGEQEKALMNVHSLLRPGGESLLIFLPKAPHFTAYRKMARNPRWAPYMHDVEKFVSPYQDCDAPGKIFRELLMRCGFRNIEVTCFARLHNQGSMSSLRALLRSFNPFLKRIPEHEKEDYVFDLMEEYMRCTAHHYRRGDQVEDIGKMPVYYAYHFLKATATK